MISIQCNPPRNSSCRSTRRDPKTRCSLLRILLKKVCNQKEQPPKKAQICSLSLRNLRAEESLRGGLGDKASDLIINRLQMKIWNSKNSMFLSRSLSKWNYQITWTHLIIGIVLQVTDYAMINCQLMRRKCPLQLKSRKKRRKMKNSRINRQ